MQRKLNVLFILLKFNSQHIFMLTMSTLTMFHLDRTAGTLDSTME